MPQNTSKNQIDVFDLGRAEYKHTWDLQAAILASVTAEKLAQRKGDIEPLQRRNDRFLFVEHPPVYTLGKSGDIANLLKTGTALDDIGATFFKIDRGGDITYHGPGQIVGYPILDLDRYFTDLHKYLRFLEDVMIAVCADYGIEAGRIEKLTGVWVGDAKICAMGVKCSRWVTMHGFAFNVNTDLSYFGHIIPCGINDKEVTSLEKLLGHPVDMNEVKQKMCFHFAQRFEADLNMNLPADDLWAEYVPEYMVSGANSGPESSKDLLATGAIAE